MKSGNQGKYMLVLRDRVFYSGLLGGDMKKRTLGAIAIYLAPSGSIRVNTSGCKEWVTLDVAIVPPYQAHQVTSKSGEIISILIEPERLSSSICNRLIKEIGNTFNSLSYVERFRAAAAYLSNETLIDELNSDAFDIAVFGHPLSRRTLQPRVETVLNELETLSFDSQVLAGDLAKMVGLSSSRFLHLFKEQTGVSFRDYRMWRRARAFLLFANHSDRLTDVALNLGYPDSSHFSHSIRKIFGLNPKSIRTGSKNLYVQSALSLEGCY